MTEDQAEQILKLLKLVVHQITLESSDRAALESALVKAGVVTWEDLGSAKGLFKEKVDRFLHRRSLETVEEILEFLGPVEEEPEPQAPRLSIVRKPQEMKPEE